MRPFRSLIGIAVFPPKYINMTFTNRNLHNLSLVTHKFKIEDRRRKVATLLAQAMTETEIAHELKRSIYYRQSTKGYRK